jgi:protein-S-isoprenylcysteine O-methyltransferase Ste14
MRIVRGSGFFLSTGLIYLGTALLGWGLADVRGFLAMAPRAAYALTVLALGLAVARVAMDSPESIRGSKGQQGRLISRQSFVRWVLVAALFGALALLPFADRRGVGVLPENQALRWVGVVLFGLSSALIMWSSVALGRLYSPEVTIQQDHRLITDGPYRYVRHPRYVGAVLLALGLPLVFRSWMALVLCPAVVAVILQRIRDEEGLMQQEFGQEWEAYCQRSWRLIPWVY